MHFYGDIALRVRSDEITLQKAWVDGHFQSEFFG